MINSNFRLSPSDIANFQEKGFLLLKSFFSPETIEQMIEMTTKQIEPPSNNYGSGFSKLKYDIGNDDQYLLSMMKEERFSRTINELCGKTVFFTQGLGFELEKNKSKGFPWHVGTQSFGFQRREDSGYTIWTPLCPIEPEGQRGGMAYVPKDLMSGEFVYQHINLLPDYIRTQIAEGKSYDFEDFSEIKNQLLNSLEMNALLNHHAIEDEFQLGDALIFDKFVMHRSVALGEGPLNARMAYALRFSSTSARYDSERVEALRYPRETFNYNVGSQFNDLVCANNGELVYDSAYFEGSRHQRTVAVQSQLETETA